MTKQYTIDTIELYAKGKITHNKKILKGEAPITKNVIVADCNGNICGTTYPKRAKGLVKNGRARFVDENKICLACPPDEFKEDSIMDINVNSEQNNAENQSAENMFTMEYVLNHINNTLKTINDMNRFNAAITAIKEMPSASGPGDDTSAEKAKAVASVVLAGETSNQQALRFLEKMYNDLKPENRNTFDLKNKAFDLICGYLNNCSIPYEEKSELLTEKRLPELFNTIANFNG